MKKMIIILILFLNTNLYSQVMIKVKNLVNIEGLSENTLIGYGIVCGLNGTGDSKRFTPTQKILGTILNNLGLDIENEKYYSQNTALVLLTAKLPPNIKAGEKININIASIGDAKNLAGGMLLQATLKGLDNKVYAIAQGPITILPENIRGQRNNLVSGLIPEGAVIQQNFSSEIIKNNRLILSLKSPDFNTLIKIRESILENYPDISINVLNNKFMEIDITEEMKRDLSGFISSIQNLEIEPEITAKIVINKQSGIIIFSGDIRLLESAVSYKNLDINIKARTVPGLSETEEKKNLFYIDSSSDIQSLINSLNKIGAKTEDIISILTALKDSGALFADIVVE